MVWLLLLVLFFCVAQAIQEDSNSTGCLRCVTTQQNYALLCETAIGLFCSAAMVDCQELQASCVLDVCWSGTPLILGSEAGVSMSFTSPAAIRQFLPALGPFTVLTNSTVNPAGGGSLFEGELLAAVLNTQLFPVHGLRFTASQQCVFLADALDGQTIEDVIALAQQMLVGQTSAMISIADMITALMLYNQGVSACFRCNDTMAPTSEPTAVVPTAPSKATSTAIVIVVLIFVSLLAVAILVGTCVIYWLMRQKATTSPLDRLHRRPGTTVATRRS